LFYFITAAAFITVFTNKDAVPETVKAALCRQLDTYDNQHTVPLITHLLITMHHYNVVSINLNHQCFSTRFCSVRKNCRRNRSYR